MIIMNLQLGDFSQHVLKVLVWFSVIRLGSFDETVQHCTSSGAIVCIGEQPVVPSNRERSH